VVGLKRLLVIGASGLLGSKIIGQAKGRFDVFGSCNPAVDGCSTSGLEPLDMCSESDVSRIFQELDPDIVILAAAMTDVDGCERNPLLAESVNAIGPGIVAKACRKFNARLLHISTDYVFDGNKRDKYIETDATDPISVYGSSKLHGESAVLAELPTASVARTAVLYGWNPIKSKSNFVTWVLKKLRNGEKATLFNDQWISPTFADDLAGALIGIAGKSASGVWHVAGPDCLDRPTCGRMIAEVFELDERLIVPAPSSSVPLSAKRPAYSCLDSSRVEKLLNRKMMPFEESLREMRRQELSER
jgi:dTDP-4-dehydrorhamnose reductase